MSDTFQCGDNAALVTYLYDECEPAQRHAIEAHVAVCAACAAELATLDSTRLQLAAWTPPETELGFEIVRSPASGLSPLVAAVPESTADAAAPQVWWRRPLPAWAQTAAALLIFATGLSLGIMRGSLPVSAPSGDSVAAGEMAAPDAVAADDLAALERRLRAEISELRTAAPAAAAPVANASVPQLLARVRTLIEESEQRQQRELALRVGQVAREFEAQRRVDLAQIQRTFGQMEGLAGAQVREQRDMLNYLMRVSQQPR